MVVWGMGHGFTRTLPLVSQIAMAIYDLEEESHHNGHVEDVDLDGVWHVLKGAEGWA